jgi:hypothetical protein
MPAESGEQLFDMVTQTTLLRIRLRLRIFVLRRRDTSIVSTVPRNSPSMAA